VSDTRLNELKRTATHTRRLLNGRDTLDHKWTLFDWAGGLPALTRMTQLSYAKYVPEDPVDRSAVRQHVDGPSGTRGGVARRSVRWTEKLQ
jgi:hypothetical protein